MEKIKSMWNGLSKKGKIGTAALIIIVVIIIISAI
jgi:flagellar biosynthesis/type III secretory pathway M-ring protein FliF/YscJ